MKRKTDASPAQGSLAMSTKKPRRRSALTALFVAAIALLLALPSFASADPLGSYKAFKTGLRPTPWIFNDVTGPEGNVWFVDNREIAGTSAVGKITPAGAITEYEYKEDGSELNEEASLSGIAVGPENKLWVTDRGIEPGIAVIDPASPGTAVEYPLEGGSKPQGIVAGPGGNLWFADASAAAPAIGKINPITHAIQKCLIPNNKSRPRGLVAGADGNLWFTDTGLRAIGKVNPSTCAVEEFATGENTLPGGSTSTSGPWGIAAGADGNVWFTGANEKIETSPKVFEFPPAIGRITPAGVITKYGTGLIETSAPLGLTTAADGKLWFTDESGREELQQINFEGAPWSTGDKFKLCGKEEVKCSEVSYSTEKETLQSNIQAALEAILGAESEISCRSEEEEETEEPAAPERCLVSFSFYTNVDQVTCTKLTGIGTCEGQTFNDGAPVAIGSLTYAGEIQRYPIDGLFGVAQVAYSGGNVWFPTGTITNTKIGKFGIEQPELTVTKEGAGTGTVVSNPAGIECGGTCTAEFEEGKKVTLTASPAANSAFLSWKGCEKGGAIGHTCTVTMDKAKTVIAKFGPTQSITLSKAGTGTGTVKSAPSGISCDGSCSSNVAAFTEGASVVLTAVPTKYNTFTGWSGSGCSGTGTCTVTMSAAKSVTAEFDATKYALTLKKAGGGTGATKSKPASLTCGATCSSVVSSFYAGTEVEVTATPSKGSTLNWSKGSGTCTGSTSPCFVTMSAAKELVAEFK